MTFRIREKKVIKRIGLIVYSIILFYTTLIGRQHCDPLSSLFTGWIVYYRNGKWNFDALYNLFLLTPFAFLMLWNFSGISSGDRNSILFRCIVMSFIVSLFIECNQLLFRIGTFQIADLVYNTISGVIGYYVYHAFHEVRQRYG